MSEVVLVPVPIWDEDVILFLYELLAERRPEINISHKEMPKFEDHQAFVRSMPYKGWWVIVSGPARVGTCYVSKQNEIGIFISRAYHRKGYGRTAVNALLEMHKGQRLLANIAPGNEASQKLFEGFGFKHIQNTFALEQ